MNKPALYLISCSDLSSNESLHTLDREICRKINRFEMLTGTIFEKEYPILNAHLAFALAKSDEAQMRVCLQAIVDILRQH